MTKSSLTSLYNLNSILYILGHHLTHINNIEIEIESEYQIL